MNVFFYSFLLIQICISTSSSTHLSCIPQNIIEARRNAIRLRLVQDYSKGCQTEIDHVDAQCQTLSAQTKDWHTQEFSSKEKECQTHSAQTRDCQTQAISSTEKECQTNPEGNNVSTQVDLVSEENDIEKDFIWKFAYWEVWALGGGFIIDHSKMPFLEYALKGLCYVNYFRMRIIYVIHKTILMTLWKEAVHPTVLYVIRNKRIIELLQHLKEEELNPIQAIYYFVKRFLQTIIVLSPLLKNMQRESISDDLQLAIKRLQGYYPKFAQSLSQREEIIPDVIIRNALKFCLEDNESEMEIDYLKRRLKDELKIDGNVEFNIEWKKSGTISQANIVTIDGKKALLKTIHDGAKIKFIIDHFIITSIIDTLLTVPRNPMSKYANNLKITKSFLPQLFTELKQEFDLSIETENMRHAHEKIKNFPKYRGIELCVPDLLFSGTVSKSMFLQSFENGISFNKLIEESSSMQEIVKYLKATLYFFGIMLFQGWFHGDLHPGNIIVDVHREKLIMIDWGSMIKFEKEDIASKIILLIAHVCENMVTTKSKAQSRLEDVRKILHEDFDFNGSTKLKNYLDHFGKEMISLGLCLKGHLGSVKNEYFHGIFALLLTSDMQLSNDGRKGELFDEVMNELEDIINPHWFVVLQKQYNFFIGMMKTINEEVHLCDLWKNPHCLDLVKEKREEEANKIYSFCTFM